jgi:predicted transcriptional regulator
MCEKNAGGKPGMSREKLRIHNTDLNNLVSNLRGEVGEIVFSWGLMRDLLAQARQRRSEPDVNELSDPHLNTLHALADKLEDEVVARLSELAERKIGRLTFYFASQKLQRFEAEVRAFQQFIERKKFTENRNSDISHKELPEKWSDHRYLRIPYPTIIRGIAMAMRLMKRIDDV